MSVIAQFVQQRVAHLNYLNGWPIDAFIPGWSIVVFKLKTKELFQKLEANINPDNYLNGFFVHREFKELMAMSNCHRIAAHIQLLVMGILFFLVHPLLVITTLIIPFNQFFSERALKNNLVRLNNELGNKFKERFIKQYLLDEAR